MQIEIIEMVPLVRTIEVELPYYYIRDMKSESGEEFIYGKIDENTHYAIHEDKQYRGDTSYHIETERYSSIDVSGLNSYFDKSYASTREAYEAARQRCLENLNKF